MMKNFLLLCLICLLVTGCASEEAGQSNLSPEAQSTTEQSVRQSEAVKIDIDLTALSSTMVYAEVYNIMMSPDDYVGKTIKGNGVYNNFHHQEMDKYFHYFVISDATGCCPQGLDFVWNGEHIYPRDYPKIGENIEVTGVFMKGEVEGQPYYYVAVDDMAVLKQ